MKTSDEIKELLKTKKQIKPVKKILEWVLGEEECQDLEFKKAVRDKQTTKGRNKGSRFERETAERLSLWWTDGVDPKALRRVPLSGGYDKTAVSGDIACLVNPLEFPLSIECKNCEGWDLLQIFEGTGPVFKWWKQCIDDEAEGHYQRSPLLIMTRNHYPVLCMVHLDFWKLFDVQRDIFSAARINNEKFNDLSGTVVLVSLDDFLKVVTPIWLKEKVKVVKRA